MLDDLGRLGSRKKLNLGLTGIGVGGMELRATQGSHQGL